MSKSFVTMEKRLCLVTGKEYSTESLLLDKHLREKFETETLTGWGFCPEVNEKLEEGFVAIVEIDEAKTKINNGKIQPEDAYRTGRIAYLRRPVLDMLIPDNNVESFMFAAEGFLAELEKMTDGSSK